VSNDSKINSVISRPISRRSLIKTGAAAGAAGFAGASLKSSKVFAAPNFLQSGPVEITYRTWFMQEPGRQDAWKWLMDTFNASQSDIKVSPIGGAFTDYSNNLVTELQSGKVDGDVIQTTPDLVLRLLKAGILTPLGSVLKANNITTLSPAHNYITVNGEPMGLDVVTVVFGLIYNKAIFDKAGVTTFPTNVDDWLALSTKLTDRPNMFGMTSPHLLSEPGDFWFTLQDWATPFDGTWATGKTPNLNTDPIIKTIELFKKFYDATFPQGTDSATVNKLWANGQIAQSLIVSAAVNSYKATAPDIYPNIRSYTLPWPSHKSVQRIHPITVNNTSKNQQAGVEFVTWLYKPENYRQLLTRQLDVIPSYEVGGLEDYYKDLLWLDGYKEITPITPPEMMGDFIYNNDEFGAIVMPHVQDVLTGSASAEDAMAAAQKEAEDLATRLES
jgi:multiple sugar transport system substrate-binding protein